MYACISFPYSHITVHIFDMPVNKYGLHMANMNHIAIMLNGHIDPTFMHMSQDGNKGKMIELFMDLLCVPHSNMVALFHYPISITVGSRCMCTPGYQI